MNPRPLLILSLALALFTAARAQDTFSIVAVDPATGEVGSAGASCVPFDVAIISDLHPGVGAINTQAEYHQSNQIYASTLMDEGLSPDSIIAMLERNDVGDTPARRQYGIAALANGGSAAAFTGEYTIDWRGHRVGATSAVQGNILLGQQIIDSIADRFERSQGRLADRLMYALLGARVAGADTRCLQYGTSSLGAYIQVARPGDRDDSLMLDLRASIPSGAVEPLDSLERLFSAWKVAAIEDETHAYGISAQAVGAGDPVRLRIDLAARAVVDVALFDAAGRRVATAPGAMLDAGTAVVRLDADLAAGTYFARVSVGRHVATCRVVVEN